MRTDPPAALIGVILLGAAVSISLPICKLGGDVEYTKHVKISSDIEQIRKMLLINSDLSKAPLDPWAQPYVFR